MKNQKFKIALILIFPLTLIFTACPTPPKKVDKIFDNVVILCDLSSRVKLVNQSEKDIEIIKKILNSFGNNQIDDGFMISKDKLTLLPAYQQTTIFDLFHISKGNLSIDMEMKASNPIDAVEFQRKKATFEYSVDTLYKEAIKSPTSGADIWGFFCSEWSRYHREGYKNKIIILTDGYLEFDNAIASKRPKGTQMTGLNLLRNKNNWEDIFNKNKLKLTPCSSSLKDLEVLIVEIAPKNKATVTNEYQIIEKFWKTWFNDMNVQSTIYQTDDGMTSTLNKIEAFMK
jgi:hypothetical protein